MDYSVMRLNLLTLAGLAFALSACGEEPPRAVSFFEANAEERETVLRDCQDGSQRGEECENAREAQQRVDHAQDTKEIEDFLAPYANGDGTEARP